MMKTSAEFRGGGPLDGRVTETDCALDCWVRVPVQSGLLALPRKASEHVYTLVEGDDGKPWYRYDGVQRCRRRRRKAG